MFLFWKVFVDGKQTESLLVGDAMVSVPLTEGTHEVTLVYENRAFNLGLKISLAAFLLLLGAFYLYRSPKNRAKGKYEK